MRAPSIVMAGGGSGGHVFPMIAVADALRRLQPNVDLSFVGTKKGLETSLVPQHGYRLRLVEILPLRGAGALGFCRGALRAATATVRERRWLSELGPGAVFSIGGYAAGPVAAAARSLGIPVALMEPNSVIGLANRLVAPFVQRAYTAFEACEHHFRPDTVLRTGVPIRAGFQRRPYQPGKPRELLVLGGSQGAKALNEALPEALGQLACRVKVQHQCGADQREAVAARYQQHCPELDVRVVPFIADMPSALEQADLVVSRAGAGAVSEIAAVGRPSLLVPYPFAAGDHQRLNAEAFEKAGAARCVRSAEATPARLARELKELLEAPARLAGMAEAAALLGRPNAAEVIAEDLLALAGAPQQARAEGESAPQGTPSGPAALRFAGRLF